MITLMNELKIPNEFKSTQILLDNDLLRIMIESLFDLQV
jgi:hypothetical protein